MLLHLFGEFNGSFLTSRGLLLQRHFHSEFAGRDIAGGRKVS